MIDTDVDRFANDDPFEVGIKYDIPTDGLFQVHWPSGQLRYEWYYKDGKRADGVSKAWWPNGNLKSEHTLKDGEKEGLWTFWHEDGQTEMEVTNKHGKIISRICWDDYGKKIGCK